MNSLNFKKESFNKIKWVFILNIAFAIVEACVVVYLRRIYYPAGFNFPLIPITDKMLILELFREASTLVMLVCIGILCGKYAWEKFAFFIISFGVWDIFFYLWLKLFS